MTQQYMTTRETAQELQVPENLVRRMVKSGAAQGFYSGNRFYIDVPAFREMLADMSRANSKIPSAR